MRSAPGSQRWSTPSDIAAQIEKLWARGHLLVPPPGNPLFPLRIPLRGPRTSEIGARYAEVDAWISTLQQGSRSQLGYGYDLERQSAGARTLGANQIPTAAVVPTHDDAITLIGRQTERTHWQRAFIQISENCPDLVPWGNAYPLAVLEHAEHWERIIAVIIWMKNHCQPGIYLRQADVPGVDTKFIEQNQSLLRSLLDIGLPTNAITDVPDFSTRYGFRNKPRILRFRFLDPKICVAGLTDISAPIEQIAGLDMSIRRVVITENELNGLAFPHIPEAIVIFGLGFGIERLAHIPWIRNNDIWYWGDIDTHGFAILDQVRSILPQTNSFLMDSETLIAHRDQWVSESIQERRALDRLTPSESDVYRGLVENRWAANLRLEQERIRYSCIADSALLIHKAHGFSESK